MAWSNLSSNQAVSFADAQTSGFPLKEGQSHSTSSRCMVRSEIVAKYDLNIGTTYANPYGDNQIVPVVDWLTKEPDYCPSLTDLSSVTRNFVGSGGYGTWYFTFTYNGPSAVQATLWYRTRRDGIYTPNQFYPPYRYTETFTPGHTYTLSAGSTESPGTYVEFEAFQCNESVIAPYVYYVNYDTEQGTTDGYATACAFGPATYPVYTNASSLSGIGSGTVIYQDPYGYPYYSGGVDRWLAIGETEDGSVTYALELDPDAVVQQNINCSTPPPLYYNTQQSGTATRDNCPAGYTAGNATLVIPANIYSSSVSQIAANNQAIAYINANKQAYANINGTCTAPPPAYYNLDWYNLNQPYSSNYIQVQVNGVTAVYNQNVSNQLQGGRVSIQAGSPVIVTGHSIYPPTGSSTVTTTVEWTGTSLSETDGPSPTPEVNITFTMPTADVLVNNTMTTVPMYHNTQQSGTATRNTCTAGYVGTTETLTVAANTYSSYVSVADANNQAIAYINTNKQAYANANGTCNAIYYNTEQSLTLARDNCPSGYIAGDATLTVAANTYSSYVSQAVANQLAIDYLYDNGQAYANANGTCTAIYYNTQQSTTATRNNCSEGYTGSTETLIAQAGTFTSTIGVQDANNKAIAYLELNAQNYANTNGTCTAPTGNVLFNGYTPALTDMADDPFIFNQNITIDTIVDSDKAFFTIPSTGTYAITLTDIGGGTKRYQIIDMYGSYSRTETFNYGLLVVNGVVYSDMISGYLELTLNADDVIFFIYPSPNLGNGEDGIPDFYGNYQFQLIIEKLS